MELRHMDDFHEMYLAMDKIAPDLKLHQLPLHITLAILWSLAFAARDAMEEVMQWKNRR